MPDIEMGSPTPKFQDLEDASEDSAVSKSVPQSPRNDMPDCFPSDSPQQEGRSSEAAVPQLHLEVDDPGQSNCQDLSTHKETSNPLKIIAPDLTKSTGKRRMKNSSLPVGYYLSPAAVLRMKAQDAMGEVEWNSSQLKKHQRTRDEILLILQELEQQIESMDIAL